MESRTAFKESESSGIACVSTCSAPGTPRLPLLALLSSWDETVNEANTSSIIATSPHLASHCFKVPLYDDIYTILCYALSLFFAIFANCKIKTNFSYYQISV
jgi:hypothetical protein